MRSAPTHHRALLWAAAFGMTCASARAGGLAMSLHVSQGKRKAATKTTRVQPSLKKKRQPRIVFRAEAGKRLKVKWKALNESKTSTHKDVLVHFYVVPEKKAGQPKVPPLGKDDVEHEGAVTLDFKPGDKAEGEFTATIAKAGSYLVRVETIGLSGREGREFYAALDVVLK